MRSGQINELCRQVAVTNFFAVDNEGKSGGLAVLWNADTNVQINSYSKHHIDFQVRSAQGKTWRGTWIYGHP